MSKDPWGDKITSEGPDGFMVIDFSRFKDIWSNVADEGEEPEAISDDFDWDDSLRNLPETLEDEPVVDYKFEKDVESTMRHMDVVEEAKTRREARDMPEFVPPPGGEWSLLRHKPRNPTKYKVDQLWPLGGNVLFAAPAKWGKSTVMMNLIRSLLTKEAFLGEFPVQQVAADEKILLVDFEMSEDRVISELLAQDWSPEYDERLLVRTLRGEASTFDLRNEQAFQYWVDYCLEHNVQTLILDPLAPLMGYMNIEENDNTTVNQFFERLNTLKTKAGVRDLMVVHHCGHTADWRPRGASRFNDWPDALWLCKLDGDIDDDPDRKFFVRGRDVGENFNGAGLITRTANDKILQFAHGASSSRQDTNHSGILNKWIYDHFQQTGTPIPTTVLIGWAAPKAATPDGNEVGVDAKKVRELLDGMFNNGQVHRCEWREQGKPIKYIPFGNKCSNPHC